MQCLRISFLCSKQIKHQITYIISKHLTQPKDPLPVHQSVAAERTHWAQSHTAPACLAGIASGCHLQAVLAVVAAAHTQSVESMAAAVAVDREVDPTVADGAAAALGERVL